MSSPFLFVVPTLNSWHLLPRFRESLLGQSFDQWNVLFVDGPSLSAHRLWLIDCCTSDPRFAWIPQDPDRTGIFGAMNQGFEYAAQHAFDWVIFWGSDDWAAAPDVLSTVIKYIECSSPCPDLIVCQGRYADSNTKILSRKAQFQPAGVLSSAAYRCALLLGATPPHQATLFGAGAYSKIARYDQSFRLSADLDYFLKLCRYDHLIVMCLDIDLVHMADGGVSERQVQKRLQEVQRAYQRAYGWFWLFSFSARYVRRLLSLLHASL